MKQCPLLLLLATTAIILSAGHALASDAPNPIDPPPWMGSPTKGSSADPIRYLFIFVTFPNTNPQNLYLTSETEQWMSDVSAVFQRQSQGHHVLQCSILRHPSDPAATWRASHTSGTYGTLESVQSIPPSFATCWVLDPKYSHYGELQAEILHSIQDTLNVHYPLGWQSPLAEADVIQFIYLPGEGNPLGGNVAGISGLNVSSSCNTLADILEEAPQSNGKLYGRCQVRASVTEMCTSQAVFIHEEGHNAMPAVDEGGHLNYWHPNEPHEYCTYGSYDIMRTSFPGGTGWCPGQFSHPARYHAGWLSPITVDHNIRNEEVHDIQDNGMAYLIPVYADTLYVVNEPDPTFNYYKYRQEYMLLAYESGAAYYSPPATGLYIWHVVTYTYYVPSLGITSCPYVKYQDLEIATGLFSDPSDTEPAWTSPDPVSGYDTLDGWIDVNTGLPRDNYWYYRGSADDLFDEQRDEFSFRTNPSSAGLSTINEGAYTEIQRRTPQNVQNSILVRVLEMGGDRCRLDILLAPAEEITTPNGKEVCLENEALTVAWSKQYTIDANQGIINTVDLLISIDGGQQWAPIASGVDATLGQYTWTPNDAQVSDNCLIKAVFHNVNTTHVGEDISDAPFSIVPAPTMQYANKSTETLVDYPGTPYSEVPLDYDNDGKQDLMITIKDSPGRLYGQNYLNSNQVPQFTNRTGDAFLAGHQPVASMRGIAVADVDNDQDRDMFIAAETQARLYSNSGFPDYKFSNVTQAAGLVPASYQSWAGSWGDYDGDGRVDLAICGVPGSGTDLLPDGGVAGWTTLMRNVSWNGAIAFSNVTASAFDDPPSTACVSAAWGDLNNDGRLDLVVTDERNLQILGGNKPALAMYYSDGDGTFTSQYLCAATMWQAGFVHDTAAVSLVDFDNDGHLDMALAQNPSWGNAWVHFNDGAGGWRDRPAVRFDVDKTIDVRYMDQDLDGRQDVLLLPMATDAPVHMMLNRSLATPDTAVFFDVASEVQLVDGGLRADGAAISDFNFDGDPDLFLGRQTVSNKFFYKNVRVTGQEASSNNWVGVRLVGTGVSNETCLGAQVKIQVGDFQQVQVVDGGSGRGGQADNVLVWGLGSRTGLITAATVWPNGETQLDTLTVNTINAVADKTPVKLLGATVTGSYVAKPGAKADWVFEWETEYAGRAALEKVTIWDATNPPQCETLGTIELTVGGPGVVSTITPTTTGRYLHRLTWEDMNCIPPCNYNYTVSSATDIKRSTSAQKQIKVKVCLQ